MKRKSEPRALHDDTNIPELTREDFKRMRPANEVLPTILPQQVAAEMLKPRRGRPKATLTKLSVTVRYSHEVVEYFRSTGPGWQVRMDEVLKKWVARHRT